MTGHAVRKVGNRQVRIQMADQAIGCTRKVRIFPVVLVAIQAERSRGIGTFAVYRLMALDALGVITGCIVPAGIFIFRWIRVAVDTNWTTTTSAAGPGATATSGCSG